LCSALFPLDNARGIFPTIHWTNPDPDPKLERLPWSKHQIIPRKARKDMEPTRPRVTLSDIWKHMSRNATTNAKVLAQLNQN
jgi:hypothetical protein